ncbi:MAG: hypothetical protein ACTHNN_03820 [Xanthobacteraceae bacterium]
MMFVNRHSGASLISAALCGVLCATCAAHAQSMPDTENGRYTLAPVADGVLRLDTRTGTMSTCNNKRIGWACYAMPDEREALDREIGRLQKDNAALRAELAQRDSATGKIEDALPKTDSLRKDAPKDSSKSAENSADSQRKLELTLPSDRDIERAMSFLERAWRRLVEMANRVQKDVSGKI